MYITFHSDASTTREGFQMTYQSVPRANVFERTVCATAVRLTADYHNPRYIKYPENETNYPNNADCGWLLDSTTFNTVINVTFTFVEIEPWCDDCIEIFDGPPSSATSLRKVRGQQLAQSLGQSLFVKFHSDGSNTGRGFQLSYQAFDSSETPQFFGVECNGQVQTRTVNVNSQTLEYPDSFSNYTVNTDCAWLLQTTSYAYVVHVTFTFLETEDGSGCPNDYVELLNGSTSYSSSLGKMCGQTLGYFYSTGPYMYVKFHSDGSRTGRGFMLAYQAVPRWFSLTVTTSSFGKGVLC